jgi:hypothetical protein
MSSWFGLHVENCLWWTLTWSPPPLCYTNHTSNSNCIQSCWFLGYITFETFDKTYGSCINQYRVQQFIDLLNHGFIILPFVVLTPPCDNKHANIPNLFHVCAPCLWPIGWVKHVVLPMLWHGRLKIELFI